MIVTADTDSVHSAIREVSNQLNPRHLAIDVKNGNLSTSWPIVMFSYITTQLNHSSSECNWVTYGQQMLAWSQLNAQLEQKTEELSYVPLPFYFKRSTNPLHFIFDEQQLTLPLPVLQAVDGYLRVGHV